MNNNNHYLWMDTVNNRIESLLSEEEYNEMINDLIDYIEFKDDLGYHSIQVCKLLDISSADLVKWYNTYFK